MVGICKSPEKGKVIAVASSNHKLVSFRQSGKMDTLMLIINVLMLTHTVSVSSLISNFTSFKYVPVKIESGSWTTDKEYEQIGVGQHGQV